MRTMWVDKEQSNYRSLCFEAACALNFDTTLLVIHLLDVSLPFPNSSTGPLLFANLSHALALFYHACLLNGFVGLFCLLVLCLNVPVFLFSSSYY